MDLDGRHVVVTGGAGGLGRATVAALMLRGARVSVFDVNRGAAEELVASHHGVGVFVCDVTDEEAVRTAVDRLVSDAGVPDVVINNAGVLHSAPLIRIASGGIESHTLQEWNRVLTLNLSSVFVVTAAVVPHMVRARKKGVIVNISSVAAAGNAGQSAYSAAKAGVNALTAVWAKELGPLGIRVAAVAPGFSDTPSTRDALSPSLLADAIARVPLRRLGHPDEIAHGILSVIENDFFTGKVLQLDGGLVI